LTDAGWVIRSYYIGEDDKEVTTGITSNFLRYGNRSRDTLTIYSGMYGGDDYLRWNVYGDITNWNFNNSTRLELRLYHDMNISLCFFCEHYIIDKTINFSSKTQVFAISVDSARLKTPIANYKIKELKKVFKQYIEFPNIKWDDIPNDPQEYLMGFPDKETGIKKPRIDSRTGKPMPVLSTPKAIIDDIYRIYKTVDPYNPNAFQEVYGKITQKHTRSLESSNLTQERGEILAEILRIEVPGEPGKKRLHSDKMVREFASRFKIEDEKPQSTVRNFFRRVFQDHNIFTFCYHEHELEKEFDTIISSKYLDNIELVWTPDWTVKDVINFYTSMFNLEWTVKDGVLHVGKELMAYEEYNSTVLREGFFQKDTESSNFRSYYGEIISCSVLSHIDRMWKCIWVKHILGVAGATTYACFRLIGQGTLLIEDYKNSLLGDTEKKLIMDEIQSNNSKQISAPNCVIKPSGEGDDKKIISYPKNVNNPESETTKTTGVVESPYSEVVPYMDHNAGILFPKMGNDYYKLIHGRRIYPVMLTLPSPHLQCSFGHKTSDVMHKRSTNPVSILPPLKGEKDFYLKLPLTENVDEKKKLDLITDHLTKKIINPNKKDGPAIYVDGYYGKILIQCEGVKGRLDNEEDIPKLPKFKEDKYVDHEGKPVTNFFPYPGDMHITSPSDLLKGEEAEDSDHEIIVPAQPEEAPMLNPYGQDETYIYMRPKDTEISYEENGKWKKRYNQISLNAGKVKLHLRDDGSQEGGLRIWRFRDDERKELSHAKFLSTKIEFQMGKYSDGWEGHTDYRSLITIRDESIEIKTKKKVVLQVGPEGDENRLEITPSGVEIQGSGTKLKILSTGVEIE